MLPSSPGPLSPLMIFTIFCFQLISMAPLGLRLVGCVWLPRKLMKGEKKTL